MKGEGVSWSGKATGKERRRKVMVKKEGAGQTVMWNGDGGIEFDTTTSRTESRFFCG
jgi:hypothetical protein